MKWASHLAFLLQAKALIECVCPPCCCFTPTKMANLSISHVLGCLPHVGEEEAGKLVEMANSLNEKDIESASNTRFVLSWFCLLRYLRAVEGNTEAALEMLHGTISWREEFGLPHSPEDINEELNGKVYVSNGQDNFGRPFFYMKPRYYLKSN